MSKEILKTTLVAAICLSGAALCNSDRDSKRRMYVAAEEAIANHWGIGTEVEHRGHQDVKIAEPSIENPNVSPAVFFKTIQWLIEDTPMLKTQFVDRCLAAFSPKD